MTVTLDKPGSPALGALAARLAAAGVDAETVRTGGDVFALVIPNPNGANVPGTFVASERDVDPEWYGDGARFDLCFYPGNGWDDGAEPSVESVLSTGYVVEAMLQLSLAAVECAA